VLAHHAIRLTLEKIAMQDQFVATNNYDPRSIWTQACAHLQLRLSPAVYNTWIQNNYLTEVRLTEHNSLVGVISSPTAFHSINVKKNFSNDLKQVLEKITGQVIELEFRVGLPTTAQTSALHPLPHSQNSVIPAAPGSFPSFTVTPSYQPMSGPEGYRNKVGSPRVEDLFSESNIQSTAAQRLELIAQKSGLRLDYKFETFAVSTTNEMAHAAAVAVSDSPGISYNPLFYYGGVGVGKTHLMHAIGNNILSKNPQTKILYCTGEAFTNDIVSAIQNKRALQFKNQYRSADVLLLDDVQFIAGKNTVQEEFFHTFNALVQQARQVVLTSDRPPHEINLLEDRLRSRFEAGLMIDIGEPSFELRTAILLIKAKNNHLSVPMDLAQLIASKVDSARKIEGIVKAIRSEVELKKRLINKGLIEELLKSDAKTAQKKLRVKPAQVIKTVANHFHLKQSAVTGKKRVKSLVTARHIAMYFLRTQLGISLTDIGRYFGDRDHTTVMHAVEKIEAEVATNQDIQQDVSALRMTLTSLSR